VNYTDNYNLRKPELTDPVDIDDLNYNADEIDSLLKGLADGLDGITPEGIGAETPTGAQQKANQAETNAKSYADQVASDLSNQAETNAKSYADIVANGVLNSAKDYADIVTNNALNSAKDYADGVLESANSHTDQVASDLSQKLNKTRIKVLDVEQDVSNINKVLINLNPNHEAKQTVSGYGTVTLPKNAANGQVSVVVKGYTGVLDMTWKQIQDLVRRGKHIDIFTVGDQFVANYNGVEYIWDVIGINHDIPTDKRYTNSLTIQAHDCLLNVQFDAPEALYYAAAELPAGQQVFTDALTNKYKFTINQAVPVGGQIVITAWSALEGETYVPTEITTYAADRITPIESALPVSVETVAADTLTPINHYQRCRYGSNNYMQSAVRQWLNSSASTFAWIPQTNFDRPPTIAFPTAGFLNLLDADLAAVIGAVDKQVAKNTVTDDGGQDTFSDKVFLLSTKEVFGANEGTIAGESAYTWYSALAGAATNNALAGRIKYLSGSVRSWWLRSPHVGLSYSPRHVGTSGYVGSGSAFGAGGLAPACCIV
jgi:hypothetical protein